MEQRIDAPAALRVEWPTLALLGACYVGWGIALWGLSQLSIGVTIILIAPFIALHSSLTHEAIHGHPSKSDLFNSMLLFPALSLCIPYLRFRDSHLAHHHDERLTDPYDDPETNYLDPVVWGRLARPLQAVLRFNNTLAGRLLIGPIIGHAVWLHSDWRAARGGDRRVFWGWLLHIPAVLSVIWIVSLSPMPIWAYLVAAYLSLSLLKIRTFLEHQAHEKARARTVIIEDRGPLALLFLNNNLHVVHHMHPAVPWYRLPKIYRANKDHYLRRNDGYRFASYGEVFRRYFAKAKDPVAHPLWPND